MQCNVVNEQRVVVSDYSFGDSIITSVNLSGSGGGIPDESFTLNYGSVIWQYHYYKHEDPSNRIDNLARGWSLLTSSMEADNSAISISDATNWHIGPARGSGGGPGSYTDIGPANVKFSKGPVVDITAPEIKTEA